MQTSFVQYILLIHSKYMYKKILMSQYFDKTYLEKRKKNYRLFGLMLNSCKHSFIIDHLNLLYYVI